MRLLLHSRSFALSPLLSLLVLFPASIHTQTPAGQRSAVSVAREAMPPRPSRHDIQVASDAYLTGARMLDRKDLVGAEVQFAKAFKLNPSNSEYSLALSLTREHRLTDLVQQSGKARLLGQSTKADSLLAEARRLDPQNSIVTQHDNPGPLPTADVAQTDPMILQTATISGPITLTPDPERQNFHLRTDLQDTIRRVTSGYHVRPVFDDSVSRTETLRFDLEDVTYAQAMPILLSMTHLFAVTLDSRSVLIAKDTPENRARLERQIQETVYVPGLTTEQLNELGNLIRQVFDIKQLTVEGGFGTLLIRAPQDTLTALNFILADLIDGGGQVMIDVKLYAIDKTRGRDTGVNVPQNFGVYSVAGAATDLVRNNQALVNQGITQGLILETDSDITKALKLIASGLVQSSLLTQTIGFFGGGITQGGITAGSSPTFKLSLNSSESRALDAIQIRVGDRQAANFRAGTRYPITTATYSSPVSSATAAQLAGVTINGISAASLLAQYGGSTQQTIPQIQYEDLGVTLKATPTVQKSNRIAMHLDLKIEALAGGALNGIPILANRQVVSDITVADGETALLVSTLSRTEARAISGIPGLGELPGFQNAVSDRLTERDSSELVILITPHIVRRRSSTLAGPRIAFTLPQQGAQN